jgi:DNA mismatch repair protein MutL
VQSGYGELLPKGKYPLAVIFIQIDPRLVDVNVHPTKNEVRFSDERGVHDVVCSIIKQSLTSSQIIPDLGTIEKKENWNQLPSARKTDFSYGKQKSYFHGTSQTKSPVSATREDGDQESKQKSFFSDPLEKTNEKSTVEQTERKEEQKAPESKKVEPGATNFWQLVDTYILSQVKGNLMVLDQHAAHERILYEEALRNLTERGASSQQVLFPTVSELTPGEFQVLEEHKELILKLGFEIKHFGTRTILVTAVPPLVRNKSGEVFLREILTQLEEEGKVEKDRTKAVAKSFACHGAIKAGERLSQEEMQSLVRQLFYTNEPYSCPHGRPTVIKLSLEELNRRFGRS